MALRLGDNGSTRNERRSPIGSFTTPMFAAFAVDPTLQIVDHLDLLLKLCGADQAAVDL